MSISKDVQKAANFDSNPPIGVSQYDESIRLFTAAYEPMFAMAYAFLRSMLPEDAEVLVVGAGTGMEICTFGLNSPRWKFTGVDPSAEMLSIAKKNIDANGLSNPVSLFNGYAHDLPGSGLFDAATCILVMHFLPDDGSKLDLLKSIGQHLKSGSPLILIDGFGARNSDEFERTVLAWKTFVKTRVGDPKMVDGGFSGQILKRLQFVPEERIEELLGEAGFGKPSRFFTGFLYGGWVTIKK
jgi:tRNA (cmo5U34)-methyltransferase